MMHSLVSCLNIANSILFSRIRIINKKTLTMPIFEYSTLQLILFVLTVILSSRFGWRGLIFFLLNPMLIAFVGQLCFTQACQESTGWYGMVLMFAMIFNLPVTLVGFCIGFLIYKGSNKPKDNVKSALKTHNDKD